MSKQKKPNQGKKKQFPIQGKMKISDRLLVQLDIRAYTAIHAEKDQKNEGGRETRGN